MNIDFEDLTVESKEELLEDARDYCISEKDVIEQFNEEAGDPANVLDFFDDDIFHYLSFVSAKIQRDLFRRYSGRITLKKDDDE